MLRPVILFVAALTLLPPVLADDDKPTDASAHVLQAEIALSRGEYLRAAEEYRKAAEVGNDVEHARRATLVADSFGFNEEALRAAKRWRALDESGEEARWYLARLQLRTGDPADAVPGLVAGRGSTGLGQSRARLAAAGGRVYQQRRWQRARADHQ